MSKTKSEYQFENVWQKVSEQLSTEIVAFWKAESALPADEDPDKRAKQVAVVMRDGDGAIAAISTVAIKRIPRLQQPLYYYRTFCAEKYRGQHTMLDMLSHCQASLLKYNTELDTPEAIGMLIELESKMLAGRYDEAQNTETGFSFIGQSPRGFNLFVRYFPGFRLQPQVPVKKK